ncbi:Clavaminate synthase-like protein [Coemansia reversa NRRL 1564]|uniref:Clavaminate synthase-like protein n=1 Tax=Coemansia reversa (strain ATCC 12441 / NRRL 1564) TaxID=763665 RepID=A0A2G5BE35_COERN|nr:Clavaminate synthase-like protein [Coemansia reversa NRRL 1564]|eukprot:PIA17280.1 Clavaminate synthase-like protein [Coemansia reversa NRRL 1564]
MEDKIERRESIDIDEFVRDFLEPNVPVVLGPAFTENWTARNEWVTDGRPNFSRIIELYHDTIVQVAECDTAFFTDQKRVEMKFSEFVHQWQENPQSHLYCKDWHFTKSNPEFCAYTPLPCLSDDWINLYCDNEVSSSDDDYRFCYMGGDGTWTPFHEDVFRSYSWSANICGEKRWTLVPPGQNSLFTDSLGGWVHNLDDYDEQRFPQLRFLKRLEFVQRAGETVFVPSGWWHQVRNVGDTISINHNWANEFNLHFLYARLASDMAAVRHALRDVADMDGFEEQVQLVLRADSGTDYRNFIRFLKYIAGLYMRKIGEPEGCPELLQFDPYFRTAFSVRRALERIDSVLGILERDEAVLKLNDIESDVAKLRLQIGSHLCRSG